jgi:hypothetical protein
VPERSFTDSEGMLVPSKDTTVRILDSLLRPLDLKAPMRNLESIREDMLAKRRLEDKLSNISQLHSPAKPRTLRPAMAPQKERDISIESIFRRLEEPRSLLARLPYIPY